MSDVAAKELAGTISMLGVLAFFGLVLWLVFRAMDDRR